MLSDLSNLTPHIYKNEFDDEVTTFFASIMLHWQETIKSHLRQLFLKIKNHCSVYKCNCLSFNPKIINLGNYDAEEKIKAVKAKAEKQSKTETIRKMRVKGFPFNEIGEIVDLSPEEVKEYLKEA